MSSSGNQKPFYLHPPSDSGETKKVRKSTKKYESTKKYQESTKKYDSKHYETPKQPNLDERLRQYSAYELNRKPTGKSGHNHRSSPNSNIRDESNFSSAEDSSGSFFLHDPSTVSYNRLSDLFPSSAHTVCSDDSGVGLTASPTTGHPVKQPLARTNKHSGNLTFLFFYKFLFNFGEFV